ncbi:MAG TPA: type IV toxin-antitoxin system AbiEi family antitoxin domain-containing protein [Acidimicrobiales bacterium]|nr:type IV toxin-antitoxin system AbiEi family antitoxin domain-containing protein [Acidimicrobiales bacterium]
MHALTPAVSSWLAEHHGVITFAELERLGVTADQIRRLLRTHVLVSYTRGIYRLAAAPATAEQAMALACAVGPDVAVSHFSAGRMWGFRRLGGDTRLHVLFGGHAHRVVPAGVVHRCHHIDPVDVVERPDGIRVTSPPRTCFDLAWVLTDERLESVIEQVIHDGMTTLPTLFSTGRRLRERGRNGSARYGRILESRPAWLKPVGSDLELRLERALLAAGAPRPLRQHALRLPNGEVIHPDFYWPVEREIVEVDHVTWHGGRLSSNYDKRRDRLVRRLDIGTTRVTDSDIRDHMPSVVADIMDVLRRTRTRCVS